jgi:hypothetical protein
MKTLYLALLAPLFLLAGCAEISTASQYTAAGMARVRIPLAQGGQKPFWIYPHSKLPGRYMITEGSAQFGKAFAEGLTLDTFDLAASQRYYRDAAEKFAGDSQCSIDQWVAISTEMYEFSLACPTASAPAPSDAPLARSN